VVPLQLKTGTLAQQGKLTATTETHHLDDINQVLQRLEHGLVKGRAVVVP
jgi:D-arabinose 1-dehydrogenase-like Zn-dependent alcohol dehydrogenase